MTRPLPRPKAVLFDLFHTLVCIPKPGGAFGPPVAETLGIAHAHDDFQRDYHEDDVLQRCVGAVRDPHEIMRRIAHRFDPTVSEERIAAAVRDRRRRIEHGILGVDPAVLVALDRLRAAGVRTALVSDAGYDDVEPWADSPLSDRFDAAVFSCEIGVRKPDRRIYEKMLDAVGVEAKDALFVGDGGSDEHRGARALGMGAVLVTRYYSYWWPDGVDARRPHADWEFEDVPAFVEALPL